MMDMEYYYEQNFLDIQLAENYSKDYDWRLNLKKGEILDIMDPY